MPRRRLLCSIQFQQTFYATLALDALLYITDHGAAGALTSTRFGSTGSQGAGGVVDKEERRHF